MTGNKNLLDTNIIVDFFQGKPQTVQFFEEKNNSLIIPSIVIGELIFGAENSSNPEKHYKKFNDFIRNRKIVNVDEDTAKIYDKIKSDLKKKENQFQKMIFGLPQMPFKITLL